MELGAISGSVSQMKWTPVEFLDYLSKLQLRYAMISLPRELLLDESALKRIRAHADELRISVILAHGSVCPSSKSFNAALGTVEEQVAPALRASQIFGARSMRCVLGSATERPEIDRHIENMVRAVRGMRTRILDSGVKLAVENHGGDLQARELKALVEAAGRDILGVCLDSANPVWMLEDPHMTLEMLGPYAETSHLRDSAVWRVPEGIAVRWVNIGEGNVDIDGWIRQVHHDAPRRAVDFRKSGLETAARLQRLRPKVLGQLPQNAGLGVQPLPDSCRARPADPGHPDTARQGPRATAVRGSRSVRATYSRVTAKHLRTSGNSDIIHFGRGDRMVFTQSRRLGMAVAFAAALYFMAPDGRTAQQPPAQPGAAGQQVRPPQNQTPKPADVEAMMAALPDKAPVKPGKPRKVLVLAKAVGFVHSSIPLAAATVDALGNKTGAWSTTVSYDPAVITTDNLKQYDALFLDKHHRRLPRRPERSGRHRCRRQALLDFVRGGKGLAGIHAASDSYHTSGGRRTRRRRSARPPRRAPGPTSTG